MECLRFIDEVPGDTVLAIRRDNKRHRHNVNETSDVQLTAETSNIQPAPSRSGLNVSGLDPDDGIITLFSPFTRL